MFYPNATASAIASACDTPPPPPPPPPPEKFGRSTVVPVATKLFKLVFPSTSRSMIVE